MPRQIWLCIAALSALMRAGLIQCAPAAAATTEPKAPPAAGVEQLCRLPGMQCSEAPWPAERGHLRARLAMIGLPALPEEGTALHLHQHLDIFIRGRSAPVPAGIGIDAFERFIAPIHTHDDAGVVHVESPTRQPFTLGQFFDIWGVRLTATCVGGYCVQDGKKLQAFVNGQAVTGDPRAIVLGSHQEIVIAYGSDDELPHPMPSRYSFPPD
jgi:hypothetical protein